MAKAPRITKQSLDPQAAARKEAFLANLATAHAGKQFAGIRVDNTRMGIEHLEVVFFDGSCDLVGKSSVYAVPICIPCGNGICNQFETHCNCPEDCK